MTDSTTIALRNMISVSILLQCLLNQFFYSMSGLFNAFDENQDGHIDFRELACGISKCCRGPNSERQKCE